MSTEPDIEAEVTFLKTEEGGRSIPAFSGYRPNHLVKDDYLTSGTHEYIEKEEVQPGEMANARITSITPEYYPHCLWIGKVINIQEGGHLVGHAKITLIMNELLVKNI